MKQYLFASILLLILQPLSLHAKEKQNFSKHSLCFIENKGQLTDQFHNPRNDIDFKMDAGNGLNIFIGNGQLHYQWSKPINTAQNKFCHGEPSRTMTADLNSKSYIEDSIATYRMDVTLLNSNPNAEIIREEKQDYYETYYTAPFSPGKGAIVYSYKRITYKNIYPYIDWVLYINNNSANTSLSLGEGRGEAIEYDFVVRPGGNVKDIQMKYGGAIELALDNNGGINARTLMGSVQEQRPYTYEKESKNNIVSKFVLKNHVLSFETGNYNGTLVIDPALRWATYYGGSNNNQGFDASCDVNGNVCITGTTNSTSNIATTGAYQTSLGGSHDAFVAKFNSAGVMQWATYYGGTGNDNGYGIACDGSNSIYIAGQTSSTSSIATAGAYQSALAGGYDDFLAKFSSTGGLQWATYYGGSDTEGIGGISYDGNGGVYIDGYTKSTGNIATSGAYQTNYGGGYCDGFLSKFNSTGALQWATYYGGSDTDQAKKVSCDGSGNVYISGWTNSNSNIATSGAYQTTYGGGAEDAFVAKFSSAGVRQWATYYGGSSVDLGWGIACDGSSNVYISGTTYSTSNIATNGAYQTSLGGMSDAFVAKFNSNGSIIWASYYGGSDQEAGYGLACDGRNAVYITGQTQSTSNIAIAGAYQTSYGGSIDAFLGKFDSSGALKWGTYYGGSNLDEGHSVVFFGRGDLYICGNTLSTNNIATAGAYQTTLSGGTEVFLAKFILDTVVSIGLPFTDTLFCTGDTFSLVYIVNDTFNTGNIFTVQLSDSSGSFTNPVNIGIDTATLGGGILCTIPASTIGGIHYRIRIVAGNPVDTSDMDELNIKIKGIPAHSVSYNNACLGDSLHLIDTAVNCNIYEWSGPNGFGSNLHNPVIANVAYTDGGMYYVTDTFLNGCSATDSVHIIIMPSPDKPVASSNSPICTGDSLKLNATDSTTGVNWLWSGPNSFSSTIQNPHRANVPLIDSGDYIVKAILNGCSAKDTVHVTVISNAAPTVGISSQPTLIVAGHLDTFTAVVSSGCDSPTYQWYINGIKMSGATSNPYHATLFIGNTISVRVYCHGGCASPDSAISNSLTTTGITSPGLSGGEVAIYPNPASSVLYIQAQGKVNVNITDIEGKVLLQYTSSPLERPGEVNISSLANGIYLIRVYDDNGLLLKIEKLLKE